MIASGTLSITHTSLPKLRSRLVAAKHRKVWNVLVLKVMDLLYASYAREGKC